MVSLLPPQSDATLPGPTRLEGEPQGDLMQAPGLPGSPAPQNVSTWVPWPEDCIAAAGPVTPTPRDLLGSALSLPPVTKYSVTPRSSSARIQASADPFSLVLGQRCASIRLGVPQI